MRNSNEATTLAKLRLAVGFSQKEMAEILGIPKHSVQNIELGKAELSDELATDLARLFNVSLEWLLDGDITKPIVNRDGKPYSERDFAVRQSEIEKRDFNPTSNRDLWNVTEALADNFGRVAAILLRALQCGQFQLYDYRLRSAMRKIYESDGRKTDGAWTELPVKAVFHGNDATITRPDVSALLDEWEIRFKKIVAQKSKGSLPKICAPIKGLPDLTPPTSNCKAPGKSAKPAESRQQKSAPAR